MRKFPVGVNVADTLMDILSGKGDKGSLYTSEDLALLWQMHANGHSTTERETAPRRSCSLDEIVLDQMVVPVQVPTDNISSAGSSQQDTRLLQQLSSRRGSTFISQFYRAHTRSCFQQYRRLPAFILEIMVSTVTGLLMGFAVIGYDGGLYQGLLIEPYTLISPAPVEVMIPMMAMIVGCGVALAGGTSCLVS